MLLQVLQKNPLISVWCCNFLPRFSSQTAPEENSNVTSPTKNVQGNQAIIMTWKVYSGTAHSLGLKETLTVLSPTSHSYSWVCWWLCSLPEWFWAPPKVLNVYRSFARYKKYTLCFNLREPRLYHPPKGKLHAKEWLRSSSTGMRAVGSSTSE